MHCNVGASVPGARSICTTKVIRYSNLGATDLDATEQSGLIWAFVRAAQRTHAHRTPTGQIGLPTAGQTVCSAPILPYSGIFTLQRRKLTNSIKSQSSGQRPTVSRAADTSFTLVTVPVRQTLQFGRGEVSHGLRCS